jgi:hypothetical protein
MSTEHVRGSSIDTRSDIYSLGVTLFEMLTARRPWTRTEPTAMAYADVIHDVLNAPLPDPRAINPDIPASIVAILNRSTAKEQSERFQSTADFQAALDAADVEEAPPTIGYGESYRAYQMPGGKHEHGLRRYREILLAALFLLVAVAGFGFYRMLGNRAAPPQLAVAEAVPVVEKVARLYQGYMRSEDARGLASLFDQVGVEYSTLGVTTRDSIEKESRKFFAGTRIESFNVQATDVAVANDSTITSTWRSVYRRISPREEVRGVSSAFVQLERRDTGWNITIFRRNGPSVDTVWTKPAPSKARPATRRIPVAAPSAQPTLSGSGEIDLTEVKNWIDRHLDVRIGPGRGHGNGNGHGKKPKKHKKEE